MQAKAKCPLCKRPTDPAFAPFCGRACRDRDLLAWLGEGYRLPVRASEDENGDTDARLGEDDD